MMRLSVRAGVALSLFVAACGGGDDPPTDPDASPGENWPPLFDPVPECEGAAIVPYAGERRVVISTLGIGDLEDGFDLDGERDHDCRTEPPVVPCNLPDNKLSAVGALAQEAIDDSFADYSVMIPFEFFDLPAAAADTCVKFALYLGAYTSDADEDGDDTARDGGDCDDTVMAINNDALEVEDGVDNDCDGLADEDPVDNTPSTSNADADDDGVTLAEGDCNDDNNLIHPGISDVCGDGLDNDCSGVADRGLDGTTIVCNPFDLANPADESIPLDPLSFDDGGAPVIAFDSGQIVAGGSTGLLLKAGPGLFSVAIPVTDDIVLDLRITGAQIEAEVVEDANGIYLQNARLGGVLDAQTADSIRGLDVPDIGLTPDKTLLDATFANLLGPLLALPKASDAVQAIYDNCRTPDIDVDGDGLEAFCDSTANGTAPLMTVDTCIDGDGTIYHDEGGVNCTAKLGTDGKPLFRDGISVELNFDTVPAGPLLAPPN
jgi:hypothetical protein